MSGAPGRAVHVFPYDPRQLGSTPGDWADAQLARWPLAAVSRSRMAPRTSVHVIGNRAATFGGLQLPVVVHRSLTSGPRFRDWGDDWSPSLGRTLGRLGPGDVTVLHLNHYAAARLVHRAAWRSRVVIVFHGRGLGPWDDHLASADRLVVLREEAADQLYRNGAAPGAVVAMVPSVDRQLFHGPRQQPAPDGPVVLGFVGRVEGSKGALEIPALVAALAATGHDVHAELVGPVMDRAGFAEAVANADVRERVHVVGPLPAAEVAERMRRWRLLLLPSYTEGQPIVALEASASGLAVATVAGVLPAELERRPGIMAAPRDRYTELVANIISGRGERLADARWVPSHEDGAAAWDALLADLGPWKPRDRLARPRPSRFRRLRPLRRGVRALRRYSIPQEA